MKTKKTWVTLFGALAFLLMLTNVLAITGSIGNARMIIQATTGEEIEKYILVKNVNDVPVSINISVSGELADNVDLKDKQFKLNAGEEKKAYFTIKALEQGTTETQINVAFTPEEGRGVGLSSTVIVVAKGEEIEDTGKSTAGGILNWLTGGKNSTSTGNNESGITGAFVTPTSIGLISTAVILVIFIILLAVYSQKVKKKKGRETKPKKKSETD